MNNYKEFANIYDVLMKDFDYKNWFNYIEDIFKKYNINPRSILEMACGTGNLSYYLAEAGYKLTCFDLSEDMLSEAYGKLRRFKNAKLLNQNMIDFKFSNKFDSVISICDSINYITEKEDLIKTFKNVWNHLDNNGIFIFDINSKYKLKHIIGNNIFVEDRDNIFYTWQNYYDEEKDICNFYLTFFSSEDGENFIRFDEEHMEKAYTIEEIRDILKDIGFSTVEYFNGFTFDEPGEKSERINFVAIK